MIDGKRHHHSSLLVPELNGATTPNSELRAELSPMLNAKFVPRLQNARNRTYLCATAVERWFEKPLM